MIPISLPPINNIIIVLENLSIYIMHVYMHVHVHQIGRVWHYNGEGGIITISLLNDMRSQTGNEAFEWFLLLLHTVGTSPYLEY